MTLEVFNENPQERLVAILEMMTRDPLAAAAELEKTAQAMLLLAANLRKAVSSGGQYCPGGLGDRVKVALVGPDNNLKQFVDV